MTLVVWLSVWDSACRCRVLLPVKKIKCTENNSVFFFMLDWVWYSSFPLHFCAAHVMDHVNTVCLFVGCVSWKRSSACWVWFVCFFFTVFINLFISVTVLQPGAASTLLACSPLWIASTSSGQSHCPGSIIQKCFSQWFHPPPQHQKTLHCFIFSADGCIPHAGRAAPNRHARAKTRDWECHWFRTTLLSRLNSSETHGFATDCTVKLFIIKNLFSAGSLRCRLWNCANIPSICLFSITTFWESKPADAPVVKNVLHSQRQPRQLSSLCVSP